MPPFFLAKSLGVQGTRAGCKLCSSTVRKDVRLLQRTTAPTVIRAQYGPSLPQLNRPINVWVGCGIPLRCVEHALKAFPSLLLIVWFVLGSLGAASAFSISHTSIKDGWSIFLHPQITNFSFVRSLRGSCSGMSHLPSFGNTQVPPRLQDIVPPHHPEAKCLLMPGLSGAKYYPAPLRQVRPSLIKLRMTVFTHTFSVCQVLEDFHIEFCHRCSN